MPAVRVKSRVSKGIPGIQVRPGTAATRNTDGFRKRRLEWILIGGGSAAALLLAVAMVLVLVFRESPGRRTGVETAGDNHAERAKTKAPRPAESKQNDLPDDLDLASALDLGMDLGIDDIPLRRPRDREPDSPVEGEEAAEARQPTDEDVEPAGPHEGSEPAGDQPDKPREEAPGEAKPDEPKKESLVEPAPTKKTKPPTFRDFPESVELPPPVAAKGRPAATEPMTLGKLYDQETAAWIVTLENGELVAPNAKLSLVRAAAEGAGRAYIVQLVRKGELTDVARMWYAPETDELKFQWLEGAASTPEAGLLRRCQLNLDIDGESRTLALSRPAPVPPLEFDFDKRRGQVTIDAGSLPDEKLLRLEITAIEGVDPKVYPFQTDPAEPVAVKKPLALTLQRLDRDRNAQPIALMQVDFTTARNRLTVARRIEQPLSRIVPPGPQLSLARQQLEEEFRIAIDQMNQATGHARVKFRPQLDRAEEIMGQIDLFEFFDKRAKIHYRILLQLGNHQVPLFDSQMASPGADLAP